MATGVVVANSGLGVVFGDFTDVKLAILPTVILFATAMVWLLQHAFDANIGTLVLTGGGAATALCWLRCIFYSIRTNRFAIVGLLAGLLKVPLAGLAVGHLAHQAPSSKDSTPMGHQVARFGEALLFLTILALPLMAQHDSGRRRPMFSPG